MALIDDPRVESRSEHAGSALDQNVGHLSLPQFYAELRDGWSIGLARIAGELQDLDPR